MEPTPSPTDGAPEIGSGEFHLLDARGAEVGDPELKRLVRRAERLGRRVLICEARVGHDVPAHAGRCRWRAAVPSRNGELVLLLTDAARISCVWSWVERPGFPWAEFRLPKRRLALEASFRRLEAPPDQGAFAVHGETADEVASAVSRRCRLRGSGDVGSAELVRMIERSQEAPLLRRIWKATRGLRILDPDCEFPDWIAARASPLEQICLALLERMRAWVDDLERGPKRRPEHLRDFKEVVEAAEGERWQADRVRRIRCEILRRNIFTLHRDAGAQERFRCWARGWVGDVAPEHMPLVLNCCLRRGPQDALPTVSRESKVPGADVLRRSLKAARDAFGTAEWTRKELSDAAEQIERRRMLLFRKYDSRASDGSVPLPLEVCFPALAPGERLDLIRRR